MAHISPAVLKMKRVDGIIITVTHYTYNPGLIHIKNSLTDTEYLDFQIYMAAQICDEFVNAIKNQRYTRGNHPWKPLTIKYYTWKKKHNLSLNIWEATGTLKNEIKVFKKGNFIAVGFSQHDYYPHTMLQINKLARWLEFGGRKLPARPLFRPIVIYMRKNVSRYFKKYQKEIIKSRKKYLYI